MALGLPLCSSRTAVPPAAQCGAPVCRPCHIHSAARRRRWPTAATAAAAAAAPASAAPELRPIQPAPAPLTADGFVPRTASPAAAPAVLQPLLQGAVAACQQCFGSTRLVGVYLRGSLAQAGCFVPGLSDADFVALHLPAGSAEEAAAEAAALAAAAARLQASFPQCAKVRAGGCCAQKGFGRAEGCASCSAADHPPSAAAPCAAPACAWPASPLFRLTFRPWPCPQAAPCTPGHNVGSGGTLQRQARTAAAAGAAAAAAAAAVACRRRRWRGRRLWPFS